MGEYIRAKNRIGKFVLFFLGFPQFKAWYCNNFKQPYKMVCIDVQDI